uniref:dihydropyrimidinase n=1 Tax=Romanomermis culicivorax TaxID=13658 RepID=A0A915J331_ROMCU
MKDEKGSGPMLVSGGRIVNDDSIWQADVFVEEGVIKQIGHNLQVPPACKVIDARGKYVIPGGIDPHVHFNLPMFGNVISVDDFYTGTKAAVAGGTTMIIDFVTPNNNESLISAYEKYRSWADPNVCCDYGLSVIIRNFSERTKNEMQEVVKNKGVNSFKFFMAYAGAFQLNDQDLYQSFVQCRKIGALARIHAECGDLIFMKEKELLAQGVTGPEGHFQARPEECQSEATTRACLLAKEANCPLYVVHVMSKGAADAIGDARRKGAVVFGEAVGSGISGINGTELFDHCFRHAAAHVMSPPLSDDSSTAAHLMDSLAAGQLQTTGSDHAVFDSNQKALGKADFTKIPNGVNGVEERMMIVWEKGVVSNSISSSREISAKSSFVTFLKLLPPKTFLSSRYYA